MDVVFGIKIGPEHCKHFHSLAELNLGVDLVSKTPVLAYRLG